MRRSKRSWRPGPGFPFCLFAFLKVYFFYFCLRAYTCTPHICLVSWIPWNWSYRQGAVWVLGIGLGSSRGTSSAPDRWAISPTALFVFKLHFHLFKCVCATTLKWRSDTSPRKQLTGAFTTELSLWPCSNGLYVPGARISDACY